MSLSGGGVSDQPAFQQAQAQANGGQGGQGGRHARSGAGHGAPADKPGGLEDIAAASAARRMAQRRGLLDTYA